MTLQEYIKSDKFIWDGINEVHLYVIHKDGYKVTTTDNEIFKVLHCEFIDYDTKPDAYFRDWYNCTFVRDCDLKITERAIIISFPEAK